MTKKAKLTTLDPHFTKLQLLSFIIRKTYPNILTKDSTRTSVNSGFCVFVWYDIVCALLFKTSIWIAANFYVEIF